MSSSRSMWRKLMILLRNLWRLPNRWGFWISMYPVFGVGQFLVWYAKIQRTRRWQRCLWGFPGTFAVFKFFACCWWTSGSFDDSKATGCWFVFQCSRRRLFPTMISEQRSHLVVTGTWDESTDPRRIAQTYLKGQDLVTTRMNTTKND